MSLELFPPTRMINEIATIRGGSPQQDQRMVLLWLFPEKVAGNPYIGD